MEQRQTGNGRQWNGGNGNSNGGRTDLVVKQDAMALARKASGRFNSLEALTDAMDALTAQCNVLTPVSRIAAVPPGHVVTLSVVMIDPEQDTYAVEGGKRCLSKAALDRIASAAGVSWDPRQSGRLDDGSDPLYCHYRAVGRIKDLDGTQRVMMGEKVMDLRDGSAQAVAAKNGLSMQRQHILAHAESKAKNRAIRSALAVRSSYRPDDLQRPFVAPKLVFTGDFGDAETNRNVASLIAMQALGIDASGAASALYGPRQPAVRAEPQAEIDLRGPAQLPPPPVNPAVRDADDDDDAIPGAPADVVEGEPWPLGDLPDDAQVAELRALAARKGRLGTGERQMSESAIAKLSPARRREAWEKLNDLPDVEADDEIRF